MAINFPATPADGTTFTDPTGRQWVYEAANTSWTAKGGAAGGMVYKGGIDVTTAPPAGVQSGWLYVVTTGGTVNAGYTGLTGVIPAGSQVVFGGPNWQLLSAPAGWARTGTELAPTNAGDSVFTSGAVKVGGTTAAPNITLKADGAASIIAPAGGEVLRVQGFRGGGPGTHAAIGLYCDTYTGASQLVMGTRRQTGALADYAKVQCESEDAVLVNGNLQFHTSNSATLAEKARITSAGDFLLGGTLPASPNIQLKADGTIRGKAINSGETYYTGVTAFTATVVTPEGLICMLYVSAISVPGQAHTPGVYCCSRRDGDAHGVSIIANATTGGVNACTVSMGAGGVITITPAAGYSFRASYQFI